jgi:hypothetical protein
MKKIQPITIWFNGQEKQAEFFNLSSNDNLKDAAQFYYQLFEAQQDAEGNDIAGVQLRDGNVAISGQDYIDWGNQPANDVNTWAYDWVAEQLNLVIIAD